MTDCIHLYKQTMHIFSLFSFILFSHFFPSSTHLNHIFNFSIPDTFYLNKHPIFKSLDSFCAFQPRNYQTILDTTSSNLELGKPDVFSVLDGLGVGKREGLKTGDCLEWWDPGIIARVSVICIRLYSCESKTRFWVCFGPRLP